MPDVPCSTTPMAPIPTATGTGFSSRWAMRLACLPDSVLTYLRRGADATDKAVEYRLIFFALGCSEIMILLALDYCATAKLNIEALATLATLIGVGNISMMHRGDG